MKRRAHAKLAIALGSIVSFTIVALGVAAPPESGGGVQTSFYAGGHRFGIGEQHVYLIDRESALTVRYRDHDGDLKSKVFHYHAQTSVAWTIEGLSSAGGPVLGVSTAAPTPAGSASPASSYATVQPVPPPNSYAAAQAAPQSPLPSPTLDPRGVAAPAPGSALAEFAPASIVLSGLGPELPETGKTWKSSGDLLLPFGTMTIALDNVIVAATGDQDSNLAKIASTGATGFQAKVKVGGFGLATLRGSGAATVTSYLETQNRLLLGTSIAATSHGNASVQDRHGSYETSVKIAIKLIKYVPGIVPYAGPQGFAPASDYLGGTTVPDSQIYSTTIPDKVAIPAATDTGFIPPPAVATPYRSALPEMSLPPIPLPMASGQSAASPPAGPTPTPQPTHY